MTEHLPEPAGYAGARTQMTAMLATAIVVSIGFSALFALLGVGAVLDGRWAHLLVYGPGAIVFATPALILLSRRERDQPGLQQFVAEHGGGEFRIQRATKETLRVSAFLLILAVGCWTFSIGVWTHALEFDLPGRRHYAAPATVAVVGVITVWALAAIAVRGTSAWLILTPEGVDYMDLGITRYRIDWNEIDGLTMAPQDEKRRRRMYAPDRLWILRSRVAKRPLSISVNWPMGNRAAYWLIHFYLTHPELRDELADDRVVERIAAGRIVDEVA